MTAVCWLIISLGLVVTVSSRGLNKRNTPPIAYSGVNPKSTTGGRTVKDVFNEYDINKDGVMTEREYKQTVFSENFKDMDNNGDGVLSKGDSAYNQYRMYDKNGDFVVDQKEMMRAPDVKQYLNERAAIFYEPYDLNKDGKISYFAFKSYFDPSYGWMSGRHNVS